MRKGRFNGIWERAAFTESLAREFYSMLGYTAPQEPRDYMEKSNHPQEKACYTMAGHAIEKMMY